MQGTTRAAAAVTMATAVAFAAPAVAGAPSRHGSTPGLAHRSLGATAACAPAPAGVNNYAPTGARRTVALTFDDGPGPTTQADIDVLTSEHVTATFFELGNQAAAHPDLVREEAGDGFALGDHTWDHKEMTALSASEQASEIRREAAEQAAVLGGRPCLFRPPYGSYNSTTEQAAASAGMPLWNWSVDTEDWKAQGSSSSYWVHRIINRAEAGGSQSHPVILMHNQATPNPATLAALRPVIHYFKSRGYTFVDLYGRTLLPPAPALARTAAGLQEVTVNANGRAHLRTRTGGAWSGSRFLAKGAADAPAAAAVGSDALVVALRTARGGVEVTRVPDGSRPGRWRPLGGRWVGRPSLAAEAGGAVALATRGLDDGAWLREQVHGGWSSWRSLGGHLIAGPAVASTGHRGLTVVGVDSRGRLVARHRSGSRWGAWQVLGGSSTADPALTGTATGSKLVLVARTSAGRLVTRIWTARHGWSHRTAAVPGAVASAPAALQDGRVLRVLAVRTGSSVSENDRRTANGRWSGWHRQH